MPQMTEINARVAEVEYMSKIADFMRSRASTMTPEDRMVEQLKIEDDIHDKFGLETEHLLFLKKEQRDKKDIANESQDTRDSSAISDFSHIDIENLPLERQPQGFKDWSRDKQRAWFKAALTKLMPVEVNSEQ